MKQSRLTCWALIAVSACCRTSGTLGGSSGEPVIQPSTGVTSPDPEHATVDFGVVPIGQTRTLDFMLANTGIASLTITHVVTTTPDAEFTLDLAEGTQIGGTPISVPTHFTPFSAGEKTAVFTLETDSSDVPSITLTLQGDGVKLDVQVVPEALDFGPVVIHTQASLPLTLTNSSLAPVTLALSAVQGTDATLFTLGALANATLAAGQVETLAVTYAPVAVSGAPSTAFFSITECQGCTALPINLRGEPVDTGLSVTPDPLDFGFSPVGSAATKTIQLANVANRPILLSTNPTLDTGHPAAAFALGANAPTFPLTLAAGQTVGVPVLFTAPALGEYTGTLTFYSDDPQASQVAVPLDGTGGGPQIQCLPASLAFGQIAVGSPVIQQVLCTNAGQDVPGDAAATLMLGALSVPDDPAFEATFDQPLPAGGLTSGQSAIIDVAYNPPAAQQDSGHLHIASNDSQTPDTVVPLSGAALVLPPCDFTVTPTLDFGQVNPGGIAQLQLVIQNEGVNDCLIRDLALASTSATAFSLPGGPIASQTLGFPGNPSATPSQLPVTVQFAPTAPGSFGGDVTFTISTPSAPSQDVHVSGSSGSGCLAVVPDLVDFGTVGFANGAWGSSLPRTLQAYNTCGSDIHIQSFTLTAGSPSFSLSAEPATLPVTVVAGGAPITFDVGFQPQGAGPVLGAVSIQTLELQSPYLVTLQGDAEYQTCSLQVAPPTLDFGSLNAGSFGIEQVAVTNIGSVVCQVSDIALSPLTDPAYTLTAPAPTAFALDAGASANVEVTFNAPDVAFATTNSGDLLFDTNDPTQPNVDVPLSGGVIGPSCPGNFPNLFTGQTDQGGSCSAGCVQGLSCGAGGLCSLDGLNSPLQIVLSWDYAEDLDLHVVEPSGCEVYYGNTACVGTLNHDAWAGCSLDGLTLEQVTYPVNTQAPTGLYTVRADFYEDCDSQTQSSHPQVPWVLQVRLGTSLTTYCGTFTPNQADQGSAGSGVTVTQFTVSPPGTPAGG